MTASGFWGLLVESGKMYSQSVPSSFKVTMASLGPEVSDDQGRTTVMLRMEDQDDYALCSLSAGKIEQQPLDLMLKEGENISFRVNGPCSVHLTGYYIPNHSQDGFIDEDECCSDDHSGEEAEEVEGEYDSEDEEDFDSEEAKETVRKIMKSKKARKHQVESETSDDGSIAEEEDTEGESVGSGSEDEEIDTDDMEDMSEVDFDSEDMSEDFDSEDVSEEDMEESDEEVVPAGKRSSVPADKKSQPEPKKIKTAETKTTEVKPAEGKSEAKPQSPKEKADTPQKENAQVNKNKESSPVAKPSDKRTLPSGLVIEDLTVGTGQKVIKDRKVGIQYIGKLTSGKVFDKSEPGRPLHFTVGKGEVIKGMDIGIQGMCVGGKRRLTIPASLAYGNASMKGIPSNSTLVFEITAETMKK